MLSDFHSEPESFFSPKDKDFDGHSATSTGSDMNSLRPGVRQRRAERVRRSRLVYDLNDVSIITIMFLCFYVIILQAYVRIERFPFSLAKCSTFALAKPAGVIKFSITLTTTIANDSAKELNA